MASKLIALVVLISALQLGQCELQRRDFFSDAVNASITNFNNNVITPFEQKVQSGIEHAKNIVKSASDKAQEVAGNAIAAVKSAAQSVSDRIQSEVNKAVQFGKNVSSCVSGESDSFSIIFNTAGGNVARCTQAVIKPVTDVLTDMQSLSGQVADVAKAFPGQISPCVSSGIFGFGPCAVQVSVNATSKINMYVSALLGDTNQLGVQGAQIPGKLTQCGTDAVSYGTSQVTAVGAAIVSCIQNGPPAAAAAPSA